MENFGNLRLYKYLIMDDFLHSVLYTTLPAEDLSLFLQAYLQEFRYMSTPETPAQVVDVVEYVKRRLDQDEVPTYWEPFNKTKKAVQIEKDVTVVQLRKDNKEV